MSTISKQLSGFVFNAAALTLASAPWKNNVRVIYSFNSGGNGYTSFKPGSNFNSLSQLVPGGVYIVDAVTTGFTIPGAELAATGTPAALTVSNTLLGFMYGDATPLTLASAPFKNDVRVLYGFNSSGNGYTSFKPGSNFNSLTQLIKDAAYILESSTLGYSLPGVFQPTLPVPIQGRMAVAVGDSLTKGYSLPNPGTQAYPQVLAGLVPYGAVLNLGINGQTVANMVGRLSSITSTYDLATYNGVDVFLLAGVNNFGHTTDSVQDVLNQYATLITGLRAPNPSKVRVFLFTLPAARWAGSVGSVAATTANVNDLNAAIRLQWASLGATDLIDLARRVEEQDPTNTTYFSDQLHDTPAGAAIKAHTVADYLLNGIQPSGPILINEPPAGFTGWVAPSSGDSSEYDVDLATWPHMGLWKNNVDSTVWADGHGVYNKGVGDTFSSPDVFAKTVKAVLITYSDGGTGKLELVRSSDGVVVATQTVSLGGAPGPALDVALTAPYTGVYFLRTTTVTTTNFLSGIKISR